MSLVTNIKEFADVLHEIYINQLSSIEGTDFYSSAAPMASDSGLFAHPHTFGGCALRTGEPSVFIPKSVVLQQAFFSIVKSILSGIVYLLRFQWLTDFSYLPLFSPEISGKSIFADTFFSEPGSHILSFSSSSSSMHSIKEGIGAADQSKKWIGEAILGGLFGSQVQASFCTGVINSFFLSVPISLPYLVTFRRLFSQGIGSAAASILGTVAGHTFFLIGILYGLRFLIIPLNSLQPITFLIGLFTIAVILNELVQEKKMYLVPLKDTRSLIRISVLNFILALCEESTVFHTVNNLTLNQENSYLQLYLSENSLPIQGVWITIVYLISFVLGHFLFSFLFCLIILKGNEQLCSLTGLTLPKTTRRINKALLLLIVTFTFSSFPYYGLDYLFMKVAGFLPEDPALTNTIFSPTQVRSRNRHFKSRAPATKNEKTVLELDLNYFDRGLYLNAPRQEKKSLTPLWNNIVSWFSTPVDIQSTKSTTSGCGSLEQGITSVKDESNEPSRISNSDQIHSRSEDYTEPQPSVVDEEGARVPERRQRSYPLEPHIENVKMDGKYENGVLYADQADLPKAPGEGTEVNQSIDPNLTFEELNYQGEYAWLMRNERARRLPDESTGGNENSLTGKKGSVFQKSQSYFKELKLKQENRQAEAALKESGTHQSRFGLLPEWKEGAIPSQRTPFLSSNGVEGGEQDKAHAFETLKTKSERVPHIENVQEGRGLRRAQSATTTSVSEAQQRPRLFEKRIKKGEEQELYSNDETRFLTDNDLSFEREVSANYSKSFASPFSEESESTPPDLLPVENIIKKRYLLNPVYRALLQTDIDSFLARQPAQYKITHNQEVSLFKKRQLLEKYYNSIRYYSPIETNLFPLAFKKKNVPSENILSINDDANYSSELEQHTRNLKNSGDHNQDFSLDKFQVCVRDPFNWVTNLSVHAAFPVPLSLTTGKNSSFPSAEKGEDAIRFMPNTKSFVETVYHQQFKGTLNTVKTLFKVTFGEANNYQNNERSSAGTVNRAWASPSQSRVLSYDQPLYKTPETYNPSRHEELYMQKEKDVSPFIEETNSAPVYAGWDDKVRRFIITNRVEFD